MNGTAGFFLDPVEPAGALQTGEAGVLIAPADPNGARLNLGIRSLETGVSLLVTVRDRNGVLRRTVSRNYAANFFEQLSASSFLGFPLEGSDTIQFLVTSGKAIIYGAQTDNKTQDPSVLYAKRSS